MLDPIERRHVQRDWLGHTIQVVAITVVLGIPLGVWGINMESSSAVLTSRLDRDEREMSEFRTYQTLITSQMSEVNKQLGMISVQITEIVKDSKSSRK